MSGVHRSGGARGIAIQQEQQTPTSNTSGVLNTFVSLRVQVMANWQLAMLRGDQH